MRSTAGLGAAADAVDDEVGRFLRVGARFGAIQPANTLVAADLVGDEDLAEIEAEADVGGAR
jgi:hypothetical protein